MKTVVLSIVTALAALSSVGSETIKLPAPDGDSGAGGSDMIATVNYHSSGSL